MDTIDLEVRFAEDPTRATPGRLVGVLVRYGEKAHDRPERVMPGALVWPPEGVNINAMHQREMPFVRVKPYEQDGAILIDQALPNTSAARDAAENLREGVFTGLSIEMRKSTIQAKYVNGERQIHHAELIGGALVDLSSYLGSTAELRNAQDAMATMPRLETLWR